MITELRAQNFKSWKDTGELQFAPLTGFFGANSSGKTSILQVLLMLKQTVKHPSRDKYEPLYFGDENDEQSLVNLKNFNNIIHGHNQDLSLDISVTWKLPKTMCIKDEPTKELLTDSLSFSTQINNKNGQTQLVDFCYTASAQKWVLEGKSQGYIFKYPEYLVQTRLMVFAQETIAVKPFRCYGVDEADREPGLGTFLPLRDAFEHLFSQIHYLGPLREHPRHHYRYEDHPDEVWLHGEKAIPALLLRRLQHNPIDNEIFEWLKRLEIIDSYRLEPNLEQKGHFELYVTKHKGGPEVRLTDVGFGVSQVLPVLIICHFAPEGSILILEHPEAHLHPKAQSELADVLIDVVKNRNIQIILESHSENLLLRLTRRIAEGEITSEDMALYSCQINDGISKIEQLEMDKYGNISNWPQDFFGDSTGDLIKKTRAEIKRRKEMT